MKIKIGSLLLAIFLLVFGASAFLTIDLRISAALAIAAGICILIDK